VTSRPAAAKHLGDLAWLRRVRDRIDGEYAQPLDVEALARGAHMSAGHLSRQFRRAFDQTDQESRRADPRAAASVTAMDITIQASFLPHDDPDASLDFYRDRPEVVPVVLLVLRAGPG
jgi:methylphosphotriester-DNA--protein-cysteine methyltransferase